VVIAKGEGVIRDSSGTIIKDYRDTGLPALLMFELPPNCDSFTIETSEMKVTQSLG
jgi:hypothetical protein